MKRTYRDYLEDMLLSAKEVLEFTAGMSLAEFLRDRNREAIRTYLAQPSYELIPTA